MEFAADEFVFLCDTNRFFHAVHHNHFEVGDFLFVTDDTDDRALLTFGKIDFEAV